MYFINSSNTNCDADVVIMHEGSPVLISLVDYEVRNRKIIADIVAEKNISLGSYDGDTVKAMRIWGRKFFFRSTMMGKKTHSIIRSDLSHSCAIEWGDRDIATTIAETLQYKHSIPVTAEIVNKVLAYEKTISEYQHSLIPLTVYSCNSEYSPKGYFIKPEMFAANLEDVDIDIPETDFDWSVINSTEDYLFQFIGDIKSRLESNIKIMLDMDKMSPRFAELGIPLYPGQVPIAQAGLEVLEREKFVYLAVEQGGGKAGHVNSKLLTPNGWSTMGQAEVGMDVIGKNGGTYKITGVYPQGKKSAYRVVFQDGTSTICCKEHLWATKSASDRNGKKDWKIRTLQEIMDHGLRIPEYPDSARARQGYRPPRQFCIPIIEPIQFSEKELPVEPYLLGALLGDGCLGGCSIKLSMPDHKLEIYERIKLMELEGTLVNRSSYANGTPYLRFTRVSGMTSGLKQQLRKLNLTVKGRDKFIPEIYKIGSEQQRLELLKGLMDTDGSVHKNRVHFHSCTRQLALDVMDIVRSLGGLANLRTKDRTQDGKGFEYVVNVKMNICPFSITSKVKQWSPAKGSARLNKFIDRVEYVGEEEMICISVDAPDKLYITDDYIVTHNTVIASAINGMHFNGNYKTLIVAPTSTLTHWKKEIAAMWPDAEVVIIHKTTDFIKYYNTGFKDKPTYFLVGKETFKLDAGKRHAVNFAVREVEYTETDGWIKVTKQAKIEVAVCPCCGKAIRNVNRKDLTYLDSDSFAKPNKSNYKCSECDEVLWQSTYDKTKKSSLSRFIRTKDIMFDSLILDEIHQSNNSGSIIGASIRNLIKYGKKSILLSGTTNNGYASSLHNLLVGLKAGLLQEDECLLEADFVQKYGTLVAVNDADEKHKRHGKTAKESSFKEVEGVNPVLFTKYLAKNYIFAELEELRTDLPGIEEHYVEIDPPKQLEYAQDSLTSDFKAANRFIWKMYENTIVRHYVNNPTGWTGVPVGEEVVYPRNLSINLPKEDKMLEIVKREIAEGRKVCIYTDFTGEDTCKYVAGLNPAKRIISKLQKEGIRVYWLKQSVKAFDRKEHIDKITNDYDVIVSNPVLVQVGVNLQAFPTYINYIPSYMVNTVDQSNRRGYRINTDLVNRVYHLYYKDTCEDSIIKRYQLKKAESKAVESKFKFEIQADVRRTASGLSKRLNDALTV